MKEIVKVAFDNGINFIDTAEGVSQLSRFARVYHGPFAQATLLVNLRSRCKQVSIEISIVLLIYPL